jgi:hypothetical protein
MFACNDCKCSHRNLQEFKRNQFLDGSLYQSYLQNPNLYLEHGDQDDGYDFLQNCYLLFEHAGQEDNVVVDKTNLSVIKSDKSHCETAQTAETNNLIEKTDWGNESSMKYFLMENQSTLARIQSVVSNAMKNHNQKKLTLFIICWVHSCLIICLVQR